MDQLVDGVLEQEVKNLALAVYVYVDNSRKKYVSVTNDRLYSPVRDGIERVASTFVWENERLNSDANREEIKSGLERYVGELISSEKSKLDIYHEKRAKTDLEEKEQNWKFFSGPLTTLRNFALIVPSGFFAYESLNFAYSLVRQGFNYPLRLWKNSDLVPFIRDVLYEGKIDSFWYEDLPYIVGWGAVELSGVLGAIALVKNRLRKHDAKKKIITEQKEKTVESITKNLINSIISN